MSPAHFFLLLLLPVLITVSGFCTAAEVATFTLGPMDRVRLGRVSPRAGALIARLLAQPRLLLLSILLLANASNVTFFVSTAVLVQEFESHTAQVLLSIVSLLGLILCADLLPLMLARRMRVEFCRIAAPALVLVVRVCGPVSRVLEDVAVVPAYRLLRPSGGGEDRPVTVEELGTMLELSAGEGLIEEDEQRLLAEVVGLAALRVRDVMVPRVAMAWVSESASIPRVRDAARGAEGAPIVVFRGSSDGQALGFLDLRRFLPAAEGDGATVRPADCIAAASFVPERARLDLVLDQLRAKGDGRALCVDEYGAIVGILTIRDILAQIVSGAAESQAPTGSTAAVQRLEPNRWLVAGRLRVGELARGAGGQGWGGASHGGVSTVAGLVLRRIGRVPSVGDEVRVANIVLRVESMKGRAVETVVVSVDQLGDAGQGGEP